MLVGLRRHYKYSSSMMTSVRKYRERVLSVNSSNAGIPNTLCMETAQSVSQNATQSKKRFYVAHLKSRNISNISSRLRLISNLSVMCVTFTFPVAIAFILDILKSDVDKFVVHIVVTLSAVIYTLICPVLLVKYMAGLKSSLVKLLHPFICCVCVFYK